ncbi:N-acyl-D-glucosamine 2-epimerase [Flavobacterium akiainvivens]|uniref:Cellobiose 2-epimerase n=1 Tax=Flavobacterium akiainvivens TaxID=1202724 RepID=A0A0M8MHS7_9FLAO|nr:AGE family epimerase/isomerase [Flavobacterium akiainvivens]KOS05858.1 N-acyl-D-glucosamine 2-epimerase [Flavobacterium akiainvivens]SFQ56706.1 mannobiose 2-epimerase [Flavobacterium akiainvivens]
MALKEDMHAELVSILTYWENNAVDAVNGGFTGTIDFNEHKDYTAEKGSVLNARILWAFSAAYPVTKNDKHLELAGRAYEYIAHNFYDKQHGGIFWSVNADGSAKDTKNQIYAIAFTIYGLSEYYSVTKNAAVLALAISLYKKIEQHSFDPIHKGYFEAFTRDWHPIDDLRLSDKDANEAKTMNTHLHIVEGYANLFRVWPDAKLKTVISELLHTINNHFMDAQTGHLRLFFNEEWVEKPDMVSYGHDIEAAWLLQWCAEVIQDTELIDIYKKHAVIMADATFEGVDNKDGGLWYEYDPHEGRLIAEKHWWPQSEFMIGMVNAWQLTGDTKYLDAVERNWQFVQEYILDKQHGEWIWGIDDAYQKIPKDKAGFWKCPYHNSRACLELIARL